MNYSKYILGIIYIFIVYFSSGLLYYFILKKNINAEKKFKQILILLFIFFILTGSWRFHAYRSDGDETHYLITIVSIIKDFDVYLENNYTYKYYENFFPNDIKIYKHHTYKINNRELPGHGVGLPILLVIPYLFGKKYGTLILYSFFMIISIYLLKKIISQNNPKNINFLYYPLPLLIVSSPLIFYVQSIFPEIAGMFFSLWICYRILCYNSKNYFKKYQLILDAGIIIYMGFLVERFVPISFVLIIFYIYHLYKIERKKIFTFFISTLLYLMFFSWINYNIYGNFSYMSCRSGGLIKSLADFSIFKILFTLLGIFIDQETGLIFFTPYFIFLFPIIYKIILEKINFINFFILSLIIVCIMSFIPFHTFWWGRHCPPGRYLVIIMPFILYFLSYENMLINKFFKKLSFILIILGVFWSFIFTAIPFLRFRGTIGNGKNELFDLLIKFNFDDFSFLFPSFIPYTWHNVPLNFITILYSFIFILITIIISKKFKEKI